MSKPGKTVIIYNQGDIRSLKSVCLTRIQKVIQIRDLLGGSHDHSAILDHYVLYVPLIGSNVTQRVVTKCDDNGNLVNMTFSDFDQISEYLYEIDPSLY